MYLESAKAPKTAAELSNNYDVGRMLSDASLYPAAFSLFLMHSRHFPFPIFMWMCKTQQPVQKEQKPHLGRRVLAERFCPRLPKLSMRGELPAGDPRDLAGDCLRWGDRRMTGGGLMTMSTEEVCSGDDRLWGGPAGVGLWAASGGTICAASCSSSFCQPATSFEFPVKGGMQKFSTL
jgi:hypothetical protein